MRRFLCINFWSRNDAQKEVKIRETQSVENVLTRRDRDNGKLIMPKYEFKECILSHLPLEKKNTDGHGERVTISVRDLDICWSRNDPQKEIKFRKIQWVEKVLTGRDIDSGQLIIPKYEFKECILSHLPLQMKNAVEHGELVTISVKDLDISTTKELILRKNASESYVLTHGWKDSFVKRKNLLIGDTVGLCWNHKELELLFTVISRVV